MFFRGMVQSPMKRQETWLGRIEGITEQLKNLRVILYDKQVRNQYDFIE